MVTEEEVARFTHRFEAHLLEFREHVAGDVLHRDKHIEMYENNMIAISELTSATKGIVDAWVFANNFQKFIKWLSAFAVLGGVVAWFMNKFPTSGA